MNAVTDTDTSTLSGEARRAIRALIDHGRLVLTAADYDAYAELDARGLVRTWHTGEGYPAWGLSDRTRELMLREFLR